MEWQIILALGLAIPVIVFPVVFIWYMSIKGAQEEASRRAREQQLEAAALLREARSRELAGSAWEYIDAYLLPTPEAANKK